MVKSYLDWITGTLLPTFFSYLNSLMIVPGVSLLAFVIAVSIVCIVVGAILFRV